MPLLEILKKIEDLIYKTEALAKEKNADYALLCLAMLAEAVAAEANVFGLEPWHNIQEDAPLSAPGEFLLRLQDQDGQPLPPYPAIMFFYQQGMTAQIDLILFLCAMNQFEKSDERQVSVNISAVSLRDPDFIKTALAYLDAMDLAEDQKVIIEVHETTPDLKMSQEVLGFFRQAGVLFALDDVGLSMDHVMRLSEFEDMADFIKLEFCEDQEGAEDNFKQAVSYITSILPETCLVAERIKSAAQAQDIQALHPQFKYVQGMHLPQDREVFARDWTAQLYQKTRLSN